MGGIGDVIGKRTDRVVHVTGADGPTLPVENGKPVESFEPGEDLLVVFSGADWLPEEVSLEGVSPDELGYVQQFDEGLAAGTATTAAVYSTPRAEAAGQRLNPIARQSPTELVTSERGWELLQDAGILETMGFENPNQAERLGTASAGETTVELLDTSTSLRTLVGVARDVDVIRLLLLNVARFERDDDVVFLAGGKQRKLLATPDDEALGTDHTDAIGNALAETDLQPLLLGGEDPLVTQGAIDATVTEMESIAPGMTVY
jgi:hypothetical protein